MSVRIEQIPGQRLASPWELAERVGADEPLLMLGSDSSDHALLAIAFDEIASDEFMLDDVQTHASHPQQLGMTVGKLGLLTYDAYNPWYHRATEPCRFFAIRESLVWEKSSGAVYRCRDEDAEQALYRIEDPLKKTSMPQGTLPSADLRWQSSWDDARYLEAVLESLEEIRDGRYYQINLLRYWRLAEALDRPRILQRLRRFAGPYAAFLDLPDLGLASWSPERFVRIYPENGKAWIEAEPIKGTRPAGRGDVQDAEAKAELEKSVKDHAELHMIVDLMRNDLQRLSVPGGVKVLDEGTVRSFATVHHLVARVRGELREKLRLEDLWRTLCPGGSITGAPKREVMEAILSREERGRGYFMGNLVYSDAATGRIDSNILIRTAVRQAGGGWEYAAGSGITVKSHPFEELQEVLTKARIVLENPW